VARLLREDAVLVCGYARAFGETPGADDEKLLVDAAKALAAFQATLVSPRTPFDSFRDALLGGDRDAAARYPIAAQRGLRIFIAGNCSACHFGPRFTNGEFGDVGIPFFTKPGEVDPGRWANSLLEANPFNLMGRHNDDASRATALHAPCQRLPRFGEFRASLRQVGSGLHAQRPFATLERSCGTIPRSIPTACTATASRWSGRWLTEQSADLVTFLRSLVAEPRRVRAAAALSKRRRAAHFPDPRRRRRVDRSARLARASSSIMPRVTAAVLSRSSCKTMGSAASVGGPWLAMLA
jgi:cytochrome c peroxidase